MTSNKLLRGNPIRKSEEDLLDREDLVNHISDLIVHDSINDSCTIGIIGKWGSGKSSVINLIEERLGDLEPHKMIFFIRFNPIDYSTDAKGISRIFFDVLIANLRDIHRDHSKLVGTYKKNKWKILNHSAKVIDSAAKEIPDIQGIIDNLESLAIAITNPAESEPIETVKNKISKILFEAKIKLIIIIDDIDRLDTEEAIQILKLIRVTANFQNVIYILAYDEHILSNMIDKKLGHDYLEKFVQVPVRLPEIDSLILQEMLYNRFIASIKEYGFEPNEYTIIACKSIQISTMRDLYILMNKFGIKIQLCYRDVSPEDLLVLTFIEMKDPALYEWIYEKRLLLCNRGKSFFKEEGTQGFSSPLDSVIDKPIMKNGSDKAVEFLYPHLFKSFIRPDMEELRKYQIRSYQICDVYFSLKVSPMAISNKVIDHILESDDRIEVFCNILTEKIKTNLNGYNSFLIKILERCNEFEYLDKICFVRALLFDEEFIDPELAERFSLDNSLQSPSKETLLDHLFKELTESDIERIFRDNLPDGNAYALALDYVYLHGLSVESNRGRELPMTQDCLDNIKKITGDKLCEAAPNFETNDNPRRSRVFFAFLSIIDSMVAKREFNHLFATDDSIIRFIEENFDEMQIRAFEKDITEELSGYIPDERLPSLIDNSNRYRNIFKRIQTMVNS